MLSGVRATGLIDPVALTGSETAFVIVAAGVLGLLIGSFLNVVIARVPEGRSVVRPPSACPHCGVPIGARDNVPVVSWLLLRGRGRCCGEPISIRYPVVELVTGVAFAAVTAWAGLSGLLPALLYLVALSIALTVIDIEHHRLPNAIVLPSYPIVLALLIVPALSQDSPVRLLVRVAICAAASYLFYFILMWIYPPGMGFGDVKLAFILGAYLGWAGWGPVIVGPFLGFLVGGLAGIVLILLRRAGMKTLIPFGPYMLIGAWLGLIYGSALTHWYLQRSGLSSQ